MYTYASLLASNRKNNEDRAEVFERGDALVVVVADGAGGLRGGAAASDAVVSAVASTILDGGVDVHEVQNWMNVLADVDHKLASAMTGETTAVIAVVGPGGILGASAGDTEAWVIGKTCIDDLTAGQKKKRLGSGRADPVAFHRPRLDGTLVLGSDGLFKYVSRERVAEAARGRTPADAAERFRPLPGRPRANRRRFRRLSSSARTSGDIVRRPAAELRRRTVKKPREPRRREKPRAPSVYRNDSRA